MSVALYMNVHVRRAVTNGLCARDLELIAKVAEPEDLKNRVEFLPL